MRHLLYLLLFGFVALFAATPAQAQVAVAARAGSLGPGLEITAGLSQRFNARVAGHYLQYKHTENVADLEVAIRGDGEVKLSSAAVFLDYYPFKRFLRLTGGAVYNMNEVVLFATPTESYTLDGKEFSPERLGTLRTTVGHKTKLHPYAGLGFGNAIRGTRLGLTLDMGVLYTNSPRIEMEGTGFIAPTANQADDLERDTEGIKLYPHVALGLSFRL